MPNIQERANSQRQANIVYKVTQATNLMKANGAMVDGFESTDKFVDELQKYLKIMKRCDSEHIADCWPTKKVRTSEGKEFEINKAKNRSQLGFGDKYNNNNNVGIILADGACIIMTYNPGAAGIAIGDPITSLTTELPAGGKFQTFLDYTSNTTGGLAFVMDVNGRKGPNSEPINNKKYDIRSFNLAKFSKGCSGTIINNKCYVAADSISPLDCSRTDGVLNVSENSAFCSSLSKYENDYWAGSLKTCADMGMIEPTHDQIRSIFSSYNDILNLPKANYWTSSILNESENSAYFRSFPYCKNCWNSAGYMKDAGPKAFCVGNIE